MPGIVVNVSILIVPPHLRTVGTCLPSTGELEHHTAPEWRLGLAGPIGAPRYTSFVARFLRVMAERATIVLFECM